MTKRIVKNDPPPEAAPVVEAAIPAEEVEITKTKEGYSYIMKGDILFDFDKAELKQVGESILRKVAVILVKHPKDTITVYGYTDSRGSKKYNLELSKRRAGSVRTVLIAEGVSKENITIVGKGESDSIDTNKTAEGRSKNRRVELDEKSAED
jgi:OOP family OmpA-OmpF porin